VHIASIGGGSAAPAFAALLASLLLGIKRWPGI
jgi:hypothetical protein